MAGVTAGSLAWRPGRRLYSRTAVAAENVAAWSSDPMKSSLGNWVRFGWLATTLALGATLLATAWVGLDRARAAASTLDLGQGQLLLEALRQSVRAEPALPDAARLDSLLRLHESGGLRYLALFDPDRHLLATAGTPVAGVPAPPPEPPPRPGALESVGRRLRMTASVMPARPAGATGLPPDLRAPGTQGPSNASRPRFRPPMLVLEFEPLAAERLVAEAARTFALSAVGAAALLAAALLFWRLSVRQEATERRFEQQRRLGALGEMSAVLAHEIRNPLASLKGHAQLLAERLGAGSPERLKAQLVVKEAERLEAERLAAEEAERIAGEMIGMKLVTHQTGPDGREVKRVLVEEGLQIARELYLGLVIDRAAERPVMMASPAGGMEIEKVAEETPDRIYKEYVHPGAGLQAFQARKLAFKLGLQGETFKQGFKFILSLFKAFVETDASLAEINPLIVAKDGRVLALDAKMNFDDNALPRHPDIAAMRDLDEESPLEVEASKFNLNYVKLDGNIGCMVNGAGLAMATMDIIKYSGGRPANFLDVGGGVTEDGVRNAFRILVSDPDVKGALINIFGGIVRCDMIAAGVIKAAREVGSTIPVVVRLEGTNVELGKKILAESGLAFHSADGMKDAAVKIVSLVK